MRVLIADDDRTVTLILSRSLKQWGFELVVAHNGEAAWQQLTELAPPLAILDWMMPGVDGLELCRRLRSTPSHAHTYVIVLTSRESKTDMIAALDAGADDYLVKPVDPEELRARVHAGLRVIEAGADTQRLLGAISSILIGVDAGGRITRWNAAAAETFGITAAEAHGRSLTECGIAWSDPEALAGIFNQDRGPVHLEDLAFTDGAHRRRLVSLTVTGMHLDAEEARGFVILGSEVTDRRVLEEQLQQAQKLEGIGQLAAGIAHEINTPMQYLGDNIRFLADSQSDLAPLIETLLSLRDSKLDPAELRAAVDKVIEQAERADLAYLHEEMPKALQQSLEGVQHVSRIVKAMKDFSHPGTETKVAVDLNRAIETTVTVARNEWKYVAEVVTELDPNLPLVPCVPGEINQVLLNLIINAAHAIADAGDAAAGRHGRITVSARGDGDQVEIRISDTGTGIPEHVRSRVFEPFFTTKAIGRGTGQGLPLAHAVVVKKHGGQIWFETELGRGTTFVVRLPLGAAQPEPQAHAG